MNRVDGLIAHNREQRAECSRFFIFFPRFFHDPISKFSSGTNLIVLQFNSVR